MAHQGMTSSSKRSQSLLAFSAAAILAVIQYAFHNASDRQLLIRSLELGLLTATGSTIIGGLLAGGLRAASPRLRAIGIYLLVALVFLPLYIQFCAWDAAGGKLGWLTVWFRSPANPLLAGLTGASIIHIATSVPLVTLWMHYVDHTQNLASQAALLDGPTWVVFLRIRLPNLLPSMLAIFSWIFLQTLGEMTITNIYLVKTYMEEVYNSLSGNIDTRQALTGILPLAAWIGMTWLLLLAALPTLFQKLLLNQQSASRIATHASNTTTPSGYASFIAIVALATLPLVSFGLRIGGDVRMTATGLSRTWSPVKAMNLLLRTPGYFAAEIQVTLLVASIAASVGLALALLLHLPFLQSRSSSKSSARFWPLGLALAIAAIPGPVIGLWLIELFGNSPIPVLNWLYDKTVFVTALAQCLKAFPLQAILSAVLFWKTPTASLEAIQLEAGSSSSNRLRLLLSQSGWGLAATWLVGFLIASGDLAYSQLVSPPGLETLPRRIFGLAHSGVDEQLAGMGLWIFFLTILLWGLCQKLWITGQSTSPTTLAGRK